MYTVKEYTIKNKEIENVLVKKMGEKEIKAYHKSLLECGYERVKGNGVVGIELENKGK